MSEPTSLPTPRMAPDLPGPLAGHSRRVWRIDEARRCVPTLLDRAEKGDSEATNCYSC